MAIPFLGALLGAAGRVAVVASRVAGRVGRAIVRSPRRIGRGLKTTFGEGGSGRVLLDNAWNIQAAMDLTGRMWEKQDGLFPRFQHVISVSVQGGPEADLRRVWYLCLAAAFGRYRNRAAGVQGVEFSATWDVTGKACSVTIGYANNGLWDVGTRTSTGLLGAQLDSGLTLIQRGPDQVTVGGSWAGWMHTMGQGVRGVINDIGNGIAGVFGGSIVPAASAQAFGLMNRALAFQQGSNVLGGVISMITSNGLQWSYRAPCNTTSAVPLLPIAGWEGVRADLLKEVPRYIGGTYKLPWRRVFITGGEQMSASFLNGVAQVPVLPDDGRIITTGERFDPRVQNPRPQIDGVSRNSIQQLVSQALTVPCYLPAAPPCGRGLQGSGGVQLYAPGRGEENTFLNQTGWNQLIDRAAEELLTGPLAAGANAVFLPGFEGPDGYTLPNDYQTTPNLRG